MAKFARTIIFLAWVIGLPAIGILVSGKPLLPFFTFPPIPTEPGKASNSWIIFGILTVLILATLTPLIWRFFRTLVTTSQESPHTAIFPWWGWLAVFWVIGSWLLAWMRLSWFEVWQRHTFSLIWISYIVALNALTYQRSGRCLLLDRSRFFAQLFLLSAGFWWIFEYLNQFVKNWHYINLPKTSPIEYFVYSSIAFSTVLPAIVSTYEWLNTFPRLTKPFDNWHKLPWIVHQKTGWIFLSLSSLGLSLMGIWPTLLFPLIWLSPLCLLLGIRLIKNEQTCIEGLLQGDWRPIVLSALAALICGFFWELWNVYSLVHWEYSIPYVHAFEVFEMPILGYSGYLPFGLTFLAITELALGYQLNYQVDKQPK